MALDVLQKAEIIENYKRTEKDTGSPEVQIAVLTAKISDLSMHLQKHTKDYHSRRGLMRSINLRGSLLKYLKTKNIERYRDLVKRLELRK